MWWLTELSRRKVEERIDKEQLLEEGECEQEINSDSGESGYIINKGANSETDASDDDSCEAVLDDSLANIGQRRTARPLPLAKGSHVSRASYHQASSSCILDIRTHKFTHSRVYVPARIWHI